MLLTNEANTFIGLGAQEHPVKPGYYILQMVYMTTNPTRPIMVHQVDNVRKKLKPLGMFRLADINGNLIEKTIPVMSTSYMLFPVENGFNK